MRNFSFGLLVGALVGSGVTYLVVRSLGHRVTSAVVPETREEGTPPPAKRRRAMPSVPRRSEGESAAPTLTDADRKTGAEGDALHVAARTVDLSQEGNVRDLTQDEIDGTLRTRAEDVIGCVVQARGAAELTGRVQIGLVVSPTGSVTQTRVEAPAYLLRQGLYRCVRPKLLTLRFPATGKDTIVRVPLDLSDR